MVISFSKIPMEAYLTKIPLPPGESNVHLSMVAFTVPSRYTAPFRCTDQSPPLGTMYFSINVCVECCKIVSLKVKFSTGLSWLPITWNRDGNCGIVIYKIMSYIWMTDKFILAGISIFQILTCLELSNKIPKINKNWL